MPSYRIIVSPFFAKGVSLGFMIVITIKSIDKSQAINND